MKKLLATLALSSAIAFLPGIAACTNSNTGSSSGKFGGLTTTESVYGFSAASAGMLVSSINVAKPAAHTAAKKASPYLMAATSLADETNDTQAGETTEVPEVTPDAGNTGTAELDRYMSLVESLLSDGGFNIVSQPSDRDGYTEKTIVSYPDMHGNTLQYVMYYNQILESSETDDKEGESEENYSIKGVMVIDGADYDIEGNKNSESEPGESETETEFTVKIDDTRYIRVEQSIETEDDESEQSFSYSLYENGKLAERSTFSYETEQNETELKMTSFKNGKTQVFYFEKEVKNGEEIIEIHIGNGTGGNGYIVRAETDENGNSRYTYEPTEFDD